MSGMILVSSWCCLVENTHGKLPKAPPQTAVCLPEQRAFLLINPPHLQPRRPHQVPLPRVQAQSRPLWSRITEQLPTDTQPPPRAAPVKFPRHSKALVSTPRLSTPGLQGPMDQENFKNTSGDRRRVANFCFAREDTEEDLNAYCLWSPSF